MTGTIKQQFADKGYGFIIGDDGRSYFFHTSGCVSNFVTELTPGCKVEFESTESVKGKRAENVTLL